MSFSGRRPEYGSRTGGSEGFREPSEASGSGSGSRSSAPPFDVLNWHPSYQSCQRYFLDVAQHNAATQAVAAFVNIQLPFQWADNPLLNASGQVTVTPPQAQGMFNPHFNFNRSNDPVGLDRGPGSPLAWVSLLPFIRRLVVTGFDKPAILHGFFGDDWIAGVGGLHEVERRNYLFMSKSVSWGKVREEYDMTPQQTVPFLKPLTDVTAQELDAAEREWGRWLAMQDWMLGPHAPDHLDYRRVHTVVNPYPRPDYDAIDGESHDRVDGDYLIDIM